MARPHGGTPNPLFIRAFAASLKFTKMAPHRVTLVNLSALPERKGAAKAARKAARSLVLAFLFALFVAFSSDFAAREAGMSRKSDDEATRDFFFARLAATPVATEASPQ